MFFCFQIEILRKFSSGILCIKMDFIEKIRFKNCRKKVFLSFFKKK